MGIVLLQDGRHKHNFWIIESSGFQEFLGEASVGKNIYKDCYMLLLLLSPHLKLQNSQYRALWMFSRVVYDYSFDDWWLVANCMMSSSTWSSRTVLLGKRVNVHHYTDTDDMSNDWHSDSQVGWKSWDSEVRRFVSKSEYRSSNLESSLYGKFTSYWLVG